MENGDRLIIWWPWKKHIHLGDAWAALNSGLFIAKKNRLKSIVLAASRMKRGSYYNIHFIDSLREYLDYNIDVKVVAMEQYEQEDKYRNQLTHEMNKLGIPLTCRSTPQYCVTYTSTKVKRVVPDQIKKKICYCFNANFIKDQLPDNLDFLIESIQELYPDHEMVELGLPLTIEEDIEHLSDCKFYIGACTGITHLCRSVKGVPMIITEPIFAFPSHACQRLTLELENKNGELINRDILLQQIAWYEKDMNAKYKEYVEQHKHKELFQ